MVLSVFLACAAAAPSASLAYAPLHGTYSHIPSPTVTLVQQPAVKLVSYQPEQKVIVETPTVHHVGSVVKSIPTAVSHQSQTIVHSKADLVQPILAHGVQKTIYTAPATKTIISSPVAYAHQVASPISYAAHGTPLAYSTLVAAPVHQAHGHAVLL